MSVINQNEYKSRRDRLAKRMATNSIAVIFSAKPKQRSNDTEYPYRQNSNFYYLTGFKEDNAALMIIKAKKSFKTVLFVQKKDETLELWTGKRLGEKKAKKLFLVDEVDTSEEFEKKFEEEVKEKTRFYYDFSVEDKRISKLKKYTKSFISYENIAGLIQRMRLIKSAAEIELITKALQITKEAHLHAMSFDKRGKFEYQLQAEIEYVFKRNGAYSDAYTSIVACGNSANTLHYIDNDQAFEEDNLILIDAGCEYDYYASDITRTIPVNGKFTKAQKELYEMVLDAQLRVIDMIKPKVKRSKLQKKSEEFLCQGLIDLGILKGELKQLLKEKKHKKYYPHGIGHWMGLDVHDECPYKEENGKEILLDSGMVITIEPAIYIDKDDKDAPAKYRGIGIRIEDDILITSGGHENLSSKIVKSVEDIEALFGK